MKNNFSFLLLVLCAMSFSSCENSMLKSKNPLDGTIWSRNAQTYPSKTEITYYLEFSDSTVTYWCDKINNKGSGTYTVSGSNVTFENLQIDVGWNDIKVIDNGTFTDNSIKLNYHIKRTLDSDSEIFIKIQ